MQSVVNPNLSSPLCELHTKDEMPIAIAIDLLTRPRSISSVRIADEGEPLRSPRFPVLGEENPRDAAMTLEDLSEVVFFRELRDLISPPSASRSPIKKR